jgi:hypothetical protein
MSMPKNSRDPLHVLISKLAEARNAKKTVPTDPMAVEAELYHAAYNACFKAYSACTKKMPLSLCNTMYTCHDKEPEENSDLFVEADVDA